MTAFLFAAREGDIETAKVMLDAGVDINQTDVDGTSGLVVSIMNKQYTFAKFLLDRGADPNVTDVKGRAALYAAVDMRNEDWSALPIAQSAKTRMPSTELIKASSRTARISNAKLTHNLARPQRHGLRRRRARRRHHAFYARGPLRRCRDACRFCSQAGADPKLTTKEGNNALLFAAGVGYRDKHTTGTENDALEALKLCIDQGLDLNQTNAKAKPLCMARRIEARIVSVKFLVEHGAKLDAKSKRGSRLWISPWVKIASACPFRMTAPLRCSESCRASTARIN